MIDCVPPKSEAVELALDTQSIVYILSAFAPKVKPCCITFQLRLPSAKMYRACDELISSAHPPGYLTGSSGSHASHRLPLDELGRQHDLFGPQFRTRIQPCH